MAKGMRIGYDVEYYLNFVLYGGAERARTSQRGDGLI